MAGDAELASTGLPDPVESELASIKLTIVTGGQPGEDVLRRLIGEAEQRGYHGTTAQLLSSLVGLYLDTGRHAEAIPHARRALEIETKLHGESAEETLIAQTNLAVVQTEMGPGDSERFEEARRLLEHVLVTRQARFGRDAPEVAYVLGKIGDLQYRNGRLAEAEITYGRQLALIEKHHGMTSAQAGTTLSMLGRVAFDDDRWDVAGPLLTRAVEVLETALGPNADALSSPLSYLVGIANRDRNYDRAIALARRWLAIDVARHGPHGKKLLAATGSLASTLYNAAQFEEAERYFLQELSLEEKYLPADSPELLATLRNLAMTYRKLGDTQQALAYERRAKMAGHASGSDVP